MEAFQTLTGAELYLILERAGPLLEDYSRIAHVFVNHDGVLYLPNVLTLAGMLRSIAEPEPKLAICNCADGWRLVKALREAAGFTQEELATRIGVSPRSIQGYEAGSVVPYRRLSQLADVCNRDIGWLLEGDTSTEHELVARLLSVVEELAVEAKRIGAVAERLEHLLGAPERRSVKADRPDPAA